MITRQAKIEMERIKDAVRRRDNECCVHCGMTNEAHRAKFGRQLDVHRTTPGSKYALAVCETVCRSCHGRLPKRKPHETDHAKGPALNVKLSPEDAERYDRLVAAATKRTGLRIGPLRILKLAMIALEEEYLREGLLKKKKR